MKVCQKCVLPETFPGINFNEEGVCNYCLSHKSAESHQKDKEEYRQRFETLVSENKGKSVYDAITAYSGGKDSSYTLALLKQKYDLNILAITFDNGFISPQTIENIRNIVENLGVDHMTFKPNFQVLSSIFRRCSVSDVFSAKTLERASTICTACMAIIKFTTLRIAAEKEIPFIAFGWSPGQAPINSSIMKNNGKMLKMTQEQVFRPLFEVAGDKVRPYFLEEKHFSGSYKFPYNIHPLAFLDYDEEVIYKTISSLGWVSPADVDANSTNCLLNSFANIVHKKRFHFNPYSFELAGLVREGCLERSTALDRLQQEEDPRTVEAVTKKLQI
jgi:tRNA(Ile)-lysidine synthase TilS/MesJ